MRIQIAVVIAFLCWCKVSSAQTYRNNGKAKVAAGGTQGYLSDKIVSGSGVSISATGDRLTISSSSSSGAALPTAPDGHILQRLSGAWQTSSVIAASDGGALIDLTTRTLSDGWTNSGTFTIDGGALETNDELIMTSADTSGLKLQNAADDYVYVVVPVSIDASWQITLPGNDGAAGQALVTDGAGVTSWEYGDGITTTRQSSTDTLSFSAATAATVGWDTVTRTPTYEVCWLWVDESMTGTFSVMCEAFRPRTNTTAEREAGAVFRQKLVSVNATEDVAAGVTELDVEDASDFTGYQLVYVFSAVSGSDEYARIRSINGNTIEFYDPLQNSHDEWDNVSSVVEYAPGMLFAPDARHIVHVVFGSSQTVDVKHWARWK